jgi:hypothetical protein
MYLLMVQLSIAAARKLIDLLALHDRFVLLASDHVSQPKMKIRD